MPRKYVKKRDGDLPKYDVLVQAIKEVKIENKPRNYVARCYKIPKTNLYRYIELLEEEEVDFSKDDVLIDFVKIHTKHGMKPVSLIFFLFYVTNC